MMFVEAYKKAFAVLAKKPMMLWGLSLLSVVITGVASAVSIGFLPVGVAFGYLINCGMAKVYLDGLEGKEVNSDQLFSCCNKGFLRIAGGMAWMQLWIIIWGLIPIVGPIFAVVKSYSYRFVPYILITKPEVSATQALRMSKEMTQGIKGQMFLADLVLYAGIFLVSLVLGLFSAIPVLGALFALVMVAFVVVVAALSPVFIGLYQASFYTDKNQEPAPIEIIEA